jgi:HSP20 family protein
MATVKWNPLKEFVLFQERDEQVLDDSLFKFTMEGAHSPNDWSPPVDIYETANRIVLKAEMPGLHRDDIGVEIAGNILTLHGEKRVEREVEEANYHRLERVFGTFERRFSLPKNVDQQSVKASYKDGVLEVSLPKIGRAQGFQVKVKID